MTNQDMENVKALLESMEFIGFGDIYVHEDYTKSLKRLVETYKKQKHQSILSAREFKKCIERKEEMIDIMLDDIMARANRDFDKMSKEDVYREYEMEAMARISKRRKNKNGDL